MVGNLREKRKVDCSKRPSEKKIWKKNGLEQKKKKKKWKKKRGKSAIWALLCKVSGIGIIWKNCAPLVFRNYFVLYISFLHS